MKHRKFHATLALTLLTALPVGAAVTYNVPGFTYEQNFDSLISSGSAPWANNSTLAGWYWARNSGAPATPSDYFANSGTLDLNVINSYGVEGVNPIDDRAFGGQNGSGNTITYGVQFTNATTSTLGSFTLAYAGEQWRQAATDPTDSLILQYRIFSGTNTNILDPGATWITATDLGFTTAVTGTNMALDGNAEANRQEISGTVNGITWEPGDTLWVRWFDTGNRIAMGIDDVSFSAVVPEPSAAVLGLVGSMMLLRRRR